MELLEVNHLCKTYGSGETAVHALKDVSFSVPKGEYVAVVGESGSGKSTLLNLIGGLDTPTSGKVLIDGKDVFTMKDRELTIFRRRNIGFIFQAFNLIPELTVEQNILFPVLLDYQKPDRAYLEELLTVLNLKDRRKHLPSQLSGGQQQRVAIGRALMTRPSLILADEPTGNLDTQNTSEVIALLKETSRKYEQTILMITHNRSHVATTGGIYYRRLGNVTKPDYPANDVYSPADNPDFSAKIVAGATENDIDLLEVYRLKEKLRIRDAGSALPDLADTTFLDNLNLIRMDKDEVRVTVAGLLFVGKAASIARLLPQAEVIYLHYSDEAQTEYDNRMDMQEPVISILDKLTERIRTYNRLTNVQVGLFRLEVYDFSEAVFQEALLNALAHRSYEDMAPVYVKHYPTKIVIENPGGFPGDINESNIITHQSIPRNKLIAMTLQHLKYVQRSGQGVDIMFQSMLTEGKPYPEYASTPNSVRLTLRSTMENQNFVRFIAETQDKRSKMFTLSELMILHYLREHQKITLKQAAKTIQETDDNAHKVLNALRDEGLLELNGKTYMLSLKVYETVKTDVAYVQDKTVSQIQAKDRILEYLKHKPSITNQKAQELCGFNKNQTYYILHQMCKDGILQPDGIGRGTKYKSVK